MRKVTLALSLLLFASTVHSAEITRNRFDALDDPAGWTHFDFTYFGHPAEIVASDSPEGGTMLRYTFPEGIDDGLEPARVWYIGNEYSEVYMQFYWKVAADWDWHSVGQKILYVYSDGSRQSMSEFGTLFGDLVYQVWGENNDITVYNGGSANLTRGQWYKFTIRLKQNTSPGSHDGIVQVWVNDVLKINSSSVMYFGPGTSVTGWNDFELAAAYGGQGSPSSLESTMYYDDFWISTTPFGAGEGDTTDPYLDTFSPADGATGVAVGTTSASFRWKDSGDGASIATLDVGGKGCASCGSCDAGLTCSGTSANYLITRTGLSFAYEDVFSEVITGSDLAGNAMSPRTWNWTIQADPSPSLAVTTTTLPNGTVGTAYSQTLAATGGTSPYTWAVTVGTLPAGLSLSSAGAITGTPTTAGVSAFTVGATDSGTPSTDDQALSITIAAATPGGDTTTQSTSFADTYIDSGSASVNYGDNAALRVYQWPLGTVANRIIVMDNADILALPDNISITSAKLRLYLTGYDGNGGTDPMRVHAKNITGTLPDTTTVTWTNFDGTLGSDLSVTDVTLVSGWFEWSILSAVQAAYAEDEPVYIALDGGSDGAADTNRTFASVDHATEAWRPQLVITYTQLTAPDGIRISVPGSLRVSTFRGSMK